MTVNIAASVDVTTLFKSCVKTIRTRNKAIGVSLPQTKAPSTVTSTQFFIKARDIQANIVSHQHLLSKHKKKYLPDHTTSLSDIKHAYIDKIITRNFKFIEEKIRNLESEVKATCDHGLSEDAKECQQCVINILRASYLRTNAYFRDMKEHRQKKQREKEQLFRLQRPSGMKKNATTSGEEKPKTILRQRRSSGKRGIENIGTPDPNKESIGSTLKKGTKEFGLENSSASHPALRDVSGASPSRPCKMTFFEDEVEGTLRDLDDEERQLLEEENVRLFNELMSNQEEVKQITKQVVELSRMQDILTENVEIQSQQIEEVHDSILHATDNVQRGNEEVREAMRKDAGFRVWIMFFIIVMSCTILFLDWYNP